MSDSTHYWVDNLDPFLIHIYGNFGVRYYGLAYLLAFIIAAVLLRLFYRVGKSPLNNEAIDSSMFALILGVMVGGRLGFMLFYRLSDFIHNPLVIFKIWEGGMSSHGGFIGVAVALFWISRKYKIPFLKLSDILCPVVPIGLFLGRIANFINGELWGKVSTVPWAVIFPKSMPVGTPINLILPRHPSQLYEAGLEGLLLGIYIQLRFWYGKPLKTPGRISGEFLIFYAIVRIIAEQFREPDSALILGMSRGSFYSIFLGISGILLLFFVHYTAKQRERDIQKKKI